MRTGAGTGVRGPGRAQGSQPPEVECFRGGGSASQAEKNAIAVLLEMVEANPRPSQNEGAESDVMLGTGKARAKSGFEPCK
jgi:hypothetical protein